MNKDEVDRAFIRAIKEHYDSIGRQPMTATYRKLICDMYDKFLKSNNLDGNGWTVPLLALNVDLI